jgi:lipoprotein NlpD
MAFFLWSCASYIAPVDTRSTAELHRAAPVTNYDPEPVTKGFHEVVQGDTLYSISWRYGLDYRDVAEWNGISGSYVIYPGQKIRLIPGQGPSGRVVTSQSPNNTSSPSNTVSKPKTPPANKVVQQRPRPAINQLVIEWHWPTNGKLIKSDTPIAQKGLDISGSEGQKIKAAANGIVVYSGSGLLGYGNLIIIKHNEIFLSAYAHNREMRVKEGDTVNAGQDIATMGKTSRGQTLLHFEIRKNGKPTDPLQYLPPQL